MELTNQTALWHTYWHRYTVRNCMLLDDFGVDVRRFVSSLRKATLTSPFDRCR